MISPLHERPRGREPAPPVSELVSLRHYQNAEHLANERTHVAYVGTAIFLLSLGAIVNRFSLFVMEHDRLADFPNQGRLVHDTTQIGLGMVLFGFTLLVLALHRYLRVERAIDRLDYRPQRRLIAGITLSALFAGTLAVIWLFLR